MAFFDAIEINAVDESSPHMMLLSPSDVIQRAVDSVRLQVLQIPIIRTNI